MIIGRSLEVVPVHAGDTIIGVIDEKNNAKIFDGKKNIFLNPKDRIIYAKISE